MVHGSSFHVAGHACSLSSCTTVPQLLHLPQAPWPQLSTAPSTLQLVPKPHSLDSAEQPTLIHVALVPHSGTKAEAAASRPLSARATTPSSRQPTSIPAAGAGLVEAAAGATPPQAEQPPHTADTQQQQQEVLTAAAGILAATTFASTTCTANPQVQRPCGAPPIALWGMVTSQRRQLGVQQQRRQQLLEARRRLQQQQQEERVTCRHQQ
jgi:hypothetical protein